MGLAENVPITRFQFTHPCGCDSKNAVNANPGSGFNSRTRVGATGRREGALLMAGVSIHAPVWVRLALARFADVSVPFQFTHPCGCDRVSKMCNYDSGSFNSRTRVGATLPKQ